MNLRPYIAWVSLLLSLMLAPLVRGEAAAAGVGEVAPVAAGTVKAAAPDLLEHLVDAVLGKFSVRSGDNTAAHYGIAALFLIGAVLLRRVATTIIFNQLKKLAAKTETTLDDKLFPALEAPVATFIMLVGIFSALQVLKLSAHTDLFIGYGVTVSFSLAIFWGLLCALGVLLDHAHEVALERQMSVAAFMPWIKKSLVAMFVVLGLLLTVQSLGYNVSAILSGLGIGGLAFALAAQDTLANLFGSIVVAIDQPFKLGETVKIGAHVGTVEDIGLRSTKLRLVDKSLIIIPNKTVSSEAIVNLSRFTGRRVEQVLALTYATKPAQLEALVREISDLIRREAEVIPTSVMVYFRDLSPSSLDLWLVYVAQDADFQKHMALRQRLNLAFMRAVEARGLAFTFPAPTVYAVTLPEERT